MEPREKDVKRRRRNVTTLLILRENRWKFEKNHRFNELVHDYDDLETRRKAR